MSTLYINRLTTVDCALLIGNDATDGSKKSEAIGFSFNVSAKIRGELDPVENVVVDFGALKKTMKAEIDNLQYGYDHKLIVGNDYDDIILTHDLNADYTTITDPSGDELFTGPANSIKIISNNVLSKALNMLSHTDMIKFLYATPDFNRYVVQPYKALLPKPLLDVVAGLELEIKDFLQTRLSELYPNAGIVIETIQCDIQPTMPVEAFDLVRDGTSPALAFQMFSYTHGLKNSTSVGCKNLMHGHLSMIAAIADFDIKLSSTKAKENIMAIQSVVNFITLELANAHFIWKENLADSLVVYNAEGRGDFLLAVDEGEPSLVSNAIVLDSESTIENLAEYIADRFGETLEAVGVRVIYVSEGLHKGSYVNVKSPR